MATKVTKGTSELHVPFYLVLATAFLILPLLSLPNVLSFHQHTIFETSLPIIISFYQNISKVFVLTFLTFQQHTSQRLFHFFLSHHIAYLPDLSANLYAFPSVTTACSRPIL